MSWLQQKLSGLWQPSTDPAPAASASSAALVAPRGKQKLSKKSRKKKIWASSPQWCKDIATLQITRATPEMKRYT